MELGDINGISSRLDRKKTKEEFLFKNAIYCINASIDREKLKNPDKTIEAFKENFQEINRIAVAGEITLLRIIS
jgi:3-hexulose-6-phosphate synthase